MNKSLLVVGSAVLIGCVLAGEMVLRRAESTPTVVVSGDEPEAAAPAEPKVVEPPLSHVEWPAVEQTPAVESAPPAGAAVPERLVAPRAATTAPAARAKAKRPPDVVPGAPPPVVPIEVARTALAYVGADADAEEVWAAAINDPSLSDHARQDLIEDLNEDGFADPAHVTVDELPLVVSRLALIEEMAPDAMDQVNADAFAEAYKDLANMYLRLTNQ